MTALDFGPRRGGRVPRYPTKLAVVADPNLLAIRVPQAWVTKSEVAAAVGALLTLGAEGCSNGSAAHGSTGGKLADHAQGRALVAPIFEHGTGHLGLRGMTGCVAVAAPVFLSEEEAAQVIREELATAGLQLNGRNVALSDVVISGHEWQTRYEWIEDNKTGELVAVQAPLAVDLYDPEHAVAIEFVSYDDYLPLGAEDTTQYAVNMKQVASNVADAVRQHGHGVYFGAFYEPVRYYRFAEVAAPELDWNSASEEQRKAAVGEYFERRDKAEVPARERAIEESKTLLKEQVRDFVAWLKGQGVI